VQLSENVVDCVNAAVVAVPDVGRLPLQPPDAVQVDALVVDQLRFEVPPCATCAGFVEIVTVGAGTAPTATVAVCAVEPPVPVQLSVYVYVRTVLSVPVDSLPMVAFVPVQSPAAAHEVALLELQFSVEDVPCRIAVGLAVSASVGGGVGGVTLTVTVCVAVPPVPVQLSVNEVVEVSPLRTSVPVRPLAPLQPPLAVQLAAFVADQPRVEAPPLTTDDGVAVSETVGGGAALTVTVTDWDADPPLPVQVSV
jgi:hypothetical protein